MAQWESQDPRTGTWVGYSAAHTKDLEKAHNGNKKPVTLKIGGTSFTVDVKNMTQSNNSGGSRSVRRNATAGSSSGGGSSSSGGWGSPAGHAGGWGSPSGAGEGGFTPTAAVKKLYEKCAGADPHKLTVNEFPALFEAVGVDITTIDSFVFCWKLGCQGCWSITKGELEQGLMANGLGDPSAKNVGAAMKKWKTEIKTMSNYQTFYKWFFGFIRNTTDVKVVITDDDFKNCVPLVLAVCPSTLYPITELFDFVMAKTKNISLDALDNLLEFSIKVKKDFSNFDDSVCWHSIIDEFMESKGR